VSESPAEPPQGNVFDLARRGYDRQQVDEHMRTLHAALADAQNAHQRERRRADWAEGELRNVQAQLEQRSAELADGRDSGGAAQGFGYRVEKLLRTAEQEAAEVRTSATREATALLERAREDAEAHRHEVEQSLIARTAMLEQEATHRKVELDERERQIAEQAEAAREDAERMLSEVSRQSEQLRQDARARAEQELLKAEKAIRERHEAAEQELGRLRSLHDEVRGQLARLLDSLAGEFGERRGTQQQQQQQQPVAARPQPRPHPRSPVSHRLTEQESLPQDQREAG
jgi:cell division septum initiation protein DivIVA